MIKLNYNFIILNYECELKYSNLLKTLDYLLSSLAYSNSEYVFC